MCVLRSCITRDPKLYPPELRYILVGYSFTICALWALFIYVSCARQRRLDANYKQYQSALTKLDEEMGLIKD
jgi:hypothetical protein